MRRTVILVFKFDEEISDNQGPKRIVENLTSRYGEDIVVIIHKGSGIKTDEYCLTWNCARYL